jgi:hypothetical protein
MRTMYQARLTRLLLLDWYQDIEQSWIRLERRAGAGAT